MGDLWSNCLEATSRSANKRGRPEACKLSTEEADALRALVIARSTGGRIRFSLAVEDFIRHPSCSEITREFLKSRLIRARETGTRPQWPRSLRRVARVTAAEQAAFRGAKHLTKEAPTIARGGFWVDVKGRERELHPYDIFESDDVSVNEPFRWVDPESGLWMAGRQTLATVDVGSAGFLGATCVGRPRDAYRMEDIADHFRDVIELHGLPEVWRLERGSWASSFVEGIEMEGRKSRWGALNDLFRVIHSETANGKGFIEQRFDMLQSCMAHTEGGITLGRSPGEFENAAQLMRRVQYDRRRAEVLDTPNQDAVQRLWTAAEAADGVRRAMERLNARPVERRWHPDPMVPVEEMANRRGRSMPSGERWRFHPIKRTAVVRKGVIEVRVDHYSTPFRFAVNGVLDSIYLDNNYPVFIAFHPGRPEEGCAIGNREMGVRNREAWGMGQIIATALPWLPFEPQVDLTTESGVSGPGIRRRFESGVRAEFRGVRQQMKAWKDHRRREIAAEDKTSRSEARDGHGRRHEVQGERFSSASHQSEPEKATPVDLSAFRNRRLADLPQEPCNAPADPLEAFRKRSLLTADERSF